MSDENDVSTIRNEMDALFDRLQKEIEKHKQADIETKVNAYAVLIGELIGANRRLLTLLDRLIDKTDKPDE